MTHLLVQFVYPDGTIDGRLCHTQTSRPGSRCIKPLASDPESPHDDTMCVEMACSPQEEVLINGTACNPSAPPPLPTPPLPRVLQ